MLRNVTRTIHLNNLLHLMKKKIIVKWKIDSVLTLTSVLIIITHKCFVEIFLTKRGCSISGQHTYTQTQ